MINKNKCLKASILLGGMLFSSMPVLAELTSVYTDLREKSCELISQDEFGNSEAQCKGVSGYQLFTVAGDIRESITIIDPKGKAHPLNFWEVVTYAPSSLGDKAEWRMQQQNGKSTPQALIVRLSTTPYDEATGNNSRRQNYLVVAKITPEKICVVGRINGGAEDNQKARILADKAAKMPCLTTVPA